jgi:hypothetical protein
VAETLLDPSAAELVVNRTTNTSRANNTANRTSSEFTTLSSSPLYEKKHPREHSGGVDSSSLGSSGLYPSPSTKKKKYYLQSYNKNDRLALSPGVVFEMQTQKCAILDDRDGTIQDFSPLRAILVKAGETCDTDLVAEYYDRLQEQKLNSADDILGVNDLRVWHLWKVTVGHLACIRKAANDIKRKKKQHDLQSCNFNDRHLPLPPPTRDDSNNNHQSLPQFHRAHTLALSPREIVETQSQKGAILGNRDVAIQDLRVCVCPLYEKLMANFQDVALAAVVMKCLKVRLSSILGATTAEDTARTILDKMLVGFSMCSSTRDSILSLNNIRNHLVHRGIRTFDECKTSRQEYMDMYHEVMKSLNDMALRAGGTTSSSAPVIPPHADKLLQDTKDVALAALIMKDLKERFMYLGAAGDLGICKFYCKLPDGCCRKYRQLKKVRNKLLHDVNADTFEQCGTSQQKYLETFGDVVRNFDGVALPDPVPTIPIALTYHAKPAKESATDDRPRLQAQQGDDMEQQSRPKKLASIEKLPPHATYAAVVEPLPASGVGGLSASTSREVTSGGVQLTIVAPQPPPPQQHQQRRRKKKRKNQAGNQQPQPPHHRQTHYQPDTCRYGPRPYQRDLHQYHAHAPPPLPPHPPVHHQMQPQPLHYQADTRHYWPPDTCHYAPPPYQCGLHQHHAHAPPPHYQNDTRHYGPHYQPDTRHYCPPDTRHYAPPPYQCDLHQHHAHAPPPHYQNDTRHYGPHYQPDTRHYCPPRQRVQVADQELLGPNRKYVATI